MCSPISMRNNEKEVCYAWVTTDKFCHKNSKPEAIDYDYLFFDTLSK